MSNEKQNNWRQKLLEPDMLPGETAYNKEAAWQLLQSRLQQTPHRKKNYLYWAAAAVLLLLGWPLLIKKTATQLLKKNIAGQQVNKAVTPSLGTKKEPIAFIIVSSPVVQKTSTKKSSKQTIQTVNTIEDPVLSVSIDTQQPPSVATAPPQPDSTTLSVATAMPEKKIPVVHINELETAVPQLALSTESVHSRWRTKRSHRSTGNQLVAAQKGNDGIINIKLSSKN